MCLDLAIDKRFASWDDFRTALQDLAIRDQFEFKVVTKDQTRG